MLYEIAPDPGPETPNVVRMVVEIPKDSSNKYEFDPSLKLFRLSRTLYSPLHYPGDYGFIPGTVAEDHEPLDVLCIVNAPSFTGCLTYVRPIAVLEMMDGEYLDHKILAVPAHDPRYDQVLSLENTSRHVQKEIEHFFCIYKELESKSTQMKGWNGIDEAYSIISKSRERYLAAAPVEA